MKIVAIFCFPLDLELTSFGTLSKLVKTGHQVHVVVVGNTIESWTHNYKRLISHSCKTIGIENILFTDRFDYSSVTQDNALVLNSIIRQVIPELVIIPFWKSYNHKLSILAKTSLIACRGIGNIVMYNFSKNAKYNPNIFVKLSKQESLAKLDSLMNYWPLLNRRFYRNNVIPFHPTTSILQNHSEKAPIEMNARSKIASFLRMRVYNQKLLQPHNSKRNTFEYGKRVSYGINSATVPKKRTLNFVYEESELLETYESHRFLLV